MRFAAGLRESLEVRGTQAPIELTRGDGLENVLGRHLLAVEGMSHGQLFTSVLLLSADGKTLSHGAAPNLPKSYCEAIDGSAIGPCAGSCGTAAFFGRPVYVADIASDPLWADYRHIALPHGFRSCWSTPIRDRSGSVIGTFAIYHLAVGGPSIEEIEAIEMITDRVADAIMWHKLVNEFERVAVETLIDGANGNLPPRLAEKLDRLEALAGKLKIQAENAGSGELKSRMIDASLDCLRLISFLRLRMESDRSSKQ